MGQLVLKQTIVEQVINEPALFGKVAETLNIGIRGLQRIIYEKPISTRGMQRLTSASVLKVIREELNIKKDSELLETLPLT